MKQPFTVRVTTLVFVVLAAPRAEAAEPEPDEPEPNEPAPCAEAQGPPAERAPSLVDRPTNRVGVSAFSSLNSGRGVLTAIGGYVELQRDAPGGFSPAARVGFEAGSGSVIYSGHVGNSDVGGAQLDIVRSLFRFDLCPLRAIGAARWSSSTANIALCARGDVGTVSSRVAGLEIFQSPWIDTGVTAQARWSFPHGFFGVELGVVGAVLRDRYFSQSHARSEETPVTTFTLAIGGGGYVL